jgi:hypothetical protein
MGQSHQGTRHESGLAEIREACSVNNLKWAHYTSSGIGQQLHVAELNAKSVITTSSTGSNAELVAQTGFTGLMMPARCLPHHIRNVCRQLWTLGAR